MNTQHTVDITPKWRALIPALVEVATKGTAPEAREVAMSELLRLADHVDRLNAERKARADEPEPLRFLVFASVAVDVDARCDGDTRTPVYHERNLLVTADSSGHAVEQVHERFTECSIHRVVKVDEALP